MAALTRGVAAPAITVRPSIETTLQPSCRDSF
jgi:hypothetical protein